MDEDSIYDARQFVKEHYHLNDEEQTLKDYLSLPDRVKRAIEYLIHLGEIQ